MHKVASQRPLPSTITLPVEAWDHREQGGAIENLNLRSFAYQHILRSLKLEITETCILTKKPKKMISPYGKIALRKFKSKEMN